MSSSTTDRRLGLTGGAAIKAPCKAATTANITLSGEQTIDGVSCVTSDRVLVKNQTTGSENGIYVVDTGAWTRDLDCDGTNDLRSGTLVRVNQGSSNAGGWFQLSTSDPITIGTTSLTWSRETINNVTTSSLVASAGQTVFTVPTYQTAANGIAVYVNGLRQRVSTDYAETNTTTITFVSGLIANDEVDVYCGASIGNLTAAAASSVSVTDATDHFVSSTVEGALAELADGIAIDIGNAGITLTNASSATINRWNTALTANRTATLSTSNAKEGARFVCVRGSGATGNFTIAIGSLATLRAPGEWCEVVYDAGTSAWILYKYGILPSAEILSQSANNGDANVTLTVGSSERTQKWSSSLSLDRTVTLSATGAYIGARFLLIRKSTSAGNRSLVVQTGGATIIHLATEQWCFVEFAGTAWIVAASGNLREPNTNIIRLYDDFLGEEINGHIWQSLIGTDSACLQAIVRPEQLRGYVRLVTGAGAAATMAVNGTLLTSRLNWQVDQGCLVCEIRVMLDAITSVALFIGLTDQDSALEIPINGAGGGDTFTNNATDAVGVLFDTTMTTANWWLVGVAAGVAATGQNSAVAPVASTMETWRIEVSAVGAATFYRNGVIIGSVLSSAVSSGVPLTPVIAAFSRTTTIRNIDSDFIDIQAMR